MWGFGAPGRPVPTPRVGPFQGTPPSSAGAPAPDTHVGEKWGTSAGAEPHQIGQHFPRPHGRKEVPTTSGGPEGVRGNQSRPQPQPGGATGPNTPNERSPNNHDFQLQSTGDVRRKLRWKSSPRYQRVIHGSARVSRNLVWITPGLLHEPPMAKLMSIVAASCLPPTSPELRRSPEGVAQGWPRRLRVT
jgi:hypothetical protein